MYDGNQITLPFLRSSSWMNILKKLNGKKYFGFSVFLFISWIALLDASPSKNFIPCYKKLQSIVGGYRTDDPCDYILPVGLSNLRNTCYMNCVLQSLFSLHPFSDYLLKPNLYVFQKDSFGEELQKLYTKMSDNAKSNNLFKSVTPLAIAKKLKIDITTQEDAEELLLKILDALDESLLPSQKSSKMIKKKKAIPEVEDALLPTAGMRIQLQQNITCIEHQHIASSKLLKHFDLSLPVRGAVTLSNALAQAFQPEILNQDNQYKCDIHGYVDATKSIGLMNFPRILTIHLKRFSFDPLTYIMKKINDPLDIPVQLNLRDHCTNHTLLANDPTIGNYTLSAVVIHTGSIEQGHYYTLAKVPTHPDDEHSPTHWVQLNDHIVTTMSEEAVLKLARGEFVTRKPTSFYEQYYGADAVSTNAYLLFYTLIE